MTRDTPHIFIALDLSEQELVELVVAPFTSGGMLMVRGAPVEATNVLRVEIFRNAVTATKSRREMTRARMRVMGKYGGFDGEAMRLLDVSDADVARTGVDVTNVYIDRAPASGISPTIAIQQETGLVFLSSTYDELRECRAKAIETIDQLDEYKCACMERFGSRVWPSLSVCREAVRSCVLYVGILGVQYGSVEIESGKSYTELEYDEARRVGIPQLVFLAANAAVDAKSEGDACPTDPRQVAFIGRVRQDLQCTRFLSASDLATKIAIAVSNWKKTLNAGRQSGARTETTHDARGGLLESTERVAVASGAALMAIKKIGTRMQALHQQLSDVSARASRLAGGPDPVRALGEARALIEEVSARIDTAAAYISDSLPALGTDLRAMGDLFQAFSESVPGPNPLTDTLMKLEGIVSAGLDTMEGYRRSALSARGISAGLDTALARYTSVLDDYMALLAKFRVACLRATRHVRARIQQ